jgi:hypothetical protein
MTTAPRRWADTATTARLAAQTLRQWRVTSYGPPYSKAGDKVLYDLDRVDAWLDSYSRTSTSDPIAA